MTRIFQIQPGAARVLIKLAQARNANVDFNGTLACIDDVQIRIFDTMEEAELSQQEYIQSHPELFEEALSVP